MSRWPLALLFLLFAVVGQAVTIDDKLANGELTVKTWVEPASDGVVTQQLQLNIEVATNTWFGKGTKVGSVVIDDVVVLQRERFAVNASVRVNGQNYAVQTWTLTLYPQRADTFTVPAIPLGITVAGNDGASIEGTVYSEPVQFTVSAPDVMSSFNTWVAASSLDVTEQWRGDLDNVAVGDALVRTITINAEDTAAMMLPEITLGDYAGVSVYRELPKVEDRVNRGSYLAKRTEEITYVFAEEGSYVVPKLTVAWWNTETASDELAVLEEQVITVGAGSLINIAPTATTTANDSSALSWRKLLPWLGGVVLIVIVVVLVRIITGRKQAAVKKQTATHYDTVFKHACQQGDVSQAINALYQWLLQQQQQTLSMRQLIAQLAQPNSEITQDFENLMQQVYGSNNSNKNNADVTVDLKDFAKQVEQLLVKANQQATAQPRLQLN